MNFVVKYFVVKRGENQVVNRSIYSSFSALILENIDFV